VYPAGFSCESRQGFVSKPVPNPWKYESRVEEETYLALLYPGGHRREKFIQVFELPGSPGVQVERIEGENLCGVRIASGTRSWEIICNHLADGRVMHQNAWTAHGRWSTDAFLLVAEWGENEELLSLAAHNASRVKLDAQMLYSSLLKGDLRIRYDDEEIAIHSALASAASADIALSPETGAECRRICLAAGQQELRLSA
jgi:hypothetical protein